MRTGEHLEQSGGYRAFVPAPVPPDPPIAFDAELARLLSDADRDLGRLDGVASVLPNPDLFVSMYVRQEAVLSSQIEGTQSTLDDVLQFEVEQGRTPRPRDVEEVINYVHAMNTGLERLRELPLSLRLIRELHATLLRGVRGGESDPGEFRRIQNWLGPPGCGLKDATYVPPPVPQMMGALDNFERFLHDRKGLPTLAHAAVAHAQFESIHPFLDGNGRMGRLLVTLLLCEREVLRRPLLYLSLYLKARRTEYYERLNAIRTDGDWEGWLAFFLRGVSEASLAATQTARSILSLREQHRHLLANDAAALRLLEHLYQQPLLSVRMAEQFLDCSYNSAASLIARLVKKQLLTEITGYSRNRLYRYEPYLALFK